MVEEIKDNLDDLFLSLPELSPEPSVGPPPALEDVPPAFPRVHERDVSNLNQQAEEKKEESVERSKR